MSFEDEIRACAARRLCRNAAATELGISVYKLREILSVMGPVEWPAFGKSYGFLEGRKKYNAPEGVALKAQQAWRDKTHLKAFGVTGSIEDLAAKFSALSGQAIRHRLKSGMSLEDALTTPRVMPKRGKPMRNMFSK